MKAFWKSKTIWVNALAVGVYAAKHALGLAAIPDIDPAYLALGNMILRILTHKPIGLTGAA